MTSADIKRIRCDLEEITRRADRAQGSLDETMRELEASEGVADLAAAERLLAKRDKQLDRSAAELDRGGKAFRVKWGDKL